MDARGVPGLSATERGEWDGTGLLGAEGGSEAAWDARGAPLQGPLAELLATSPNRAR